MSSSTDFRPGDRVIFTEEVSRKDYSGEVIQTKPRAIIVKFDDDGKNWQVRADQVRPE